jgi:hypothetical protein
LTFLLRSATLLLHPSCIPIVTLKLLLRLGVIGNILKDVLDIGASLVPTKISGRELVSQDHGLIIFLFDYICSWRIIAILADSALRVLRLWVLIML